MAGWQEVAAVLGRQGAPWLLRESLCDFCPPAMPQSPRYIRTHCAFCAGTSRDVVVCTLSRSGRETRRPYRDIDVELAGGKRCGSTDVVEWTMREVLDAHGMHQCM